VSAKQLARLAAILVILLLVWGAAALARRQGAKPSGGTFRLPRVSRAAVDTVVISRAKDSTVLARKDSTSWTVNGHPAASNSVADLLNALSDTSVTGELVAERKASQPGLGVDDSAGTRVRIGAKNKPLADLVVGKKSQDFSGGYVRQAGQESTYMVRGQLVEVVTRDPDEWRDHRIAKVAADSISRIEFARGSRRYALVRGDKKWELVPGGTADSAKVGDLLTAYSSIEASGFATPSQADSARFTSPDRRVRVLRKNGTALLTLLFDSTATGYWVRPDTGKTVYKLESWSADRLAPADTTLRLHQLNQKKQP
jgi:uncharacterized protein DUF4340